MLNTTTSQGILANWRGKRVKKRTAKTAAQARQELLQTRRDNLRAVAAERGGVTGLAKTLGYKGPSYLSQMIGPQHNRDISESTAREIEHALGLPVRFLDESQGLDRRPSVVALAEGREPVPIQIDEPLFLQVADTLRALLRTLPAPLAKDKAHSIFVRVYADAERSGKIDAELARDLVRLAT